MTTFWDIVFGGPITLVSLWIVLFLLLPASLVVGIGSIVQSAIRKVERYPFCFKLLACLMTITIIIGSLLSISAMSEAFDALSYGSGAAKQMALAMNISNSLYGSAFALLFSLPYLFFIAVSLIILHFKKPEQPAISKEV